MLQWLLTHSPLFYYTQSLWRDEAFSILTAERPISFFFTHTTFEPPFYYILLHFWMKVFGESEIAVRSLSFLAFALATGIVIEWSGKLFKKHFLSWFLPTLFFLNPMLIYYAFEVRTYGWYIFFTVASLSTYWGKLWKWYIVSTVLGFYTHTYFIFVPVVEGLHWILTRSWTAKNVKPRTLFREPMVRSLSIVVLAIAPWLIKIILELSKLKTSWYFPVNFNLVKSVLGNMYLGYEGTPWYGWTYTAYLSLILLCLFLFALKLKSTRKRNVLFFLMVTVPLALIIGISFKKPLFVNRYLISVSVAEVFLVAFAIEALKNRLLQFIVATSALLFSVGFNVWYPQEHPKLNVRATFTEINALKKQDDLIFALSPLIFFESVYYSSDRSEVFLYNPEGSAFPWYVGDTIVSSNQFARDLPLYPTRAFLISEDGSFKIAYRLTSNYTLSVKRQ